MTEVSCTFVKCKYNDYGKKGICQAKYIQIGGQCAQGEKDVEPVCVWFSRKEKEQAKFIDSRPSVVALTYLLKHIQSIALAVRYGRSNWAWETERGEGLKQRIADARNYLLLLAACIDDEVSDDDENMDC